MTQGQIYMDPTNLSLRHDPMADLYVDPTYLSPTT